MLQRKTPHLRPFDTSVMEHAPPPPMARGVLLPFQVFSGFRLTASRPLFLCMQSATAPATFPATRSGNLFILPKYCHAIDTATACDPAPVRFWHGFSTVSRPRRDAGRLGLHTTHNTGAVTYLPRAPGLARR